MGAIDYGRFQRMLLRCAEVASAAGMKASVVRVYEGTLKPEAEGFLAAHEAVRRAEGATRRESREAADALAALDSPYREARSVVRAFVPYSTLPDTLRAQPTDMDKADALEKLLDVLDDHSGETWADELSQGKFGQKAALIVKEMNEGVAGNKALALARDTRALAYGPAYERYLRFKRVVRHALGPKSWHFKRIHMRSASAVDDAGPETRPEMPMRSIPPAEPMEPSPLSATS